MLGESPVSAVGLGGGGARQRLANQLKAGFSFGAVAVSPGRDNPPVVASRASSERYRATVEAGFPRGEPSDGSSLFFIVWSFPSALDWRRRYYDRC